MDLAAFSFDALLTLKQEVDGEVESRKAREIEVLRAKVAESAQTLGVSIHELFGLQHSAKRETKHARGKQLPSIAAPAARNGAAAGRASPLDEAVPREGQVQGGLPD